MNDDGRAMIQSNQALVDSDAQSPALSPHPSLLVPQLSAISADNFAAVSAELLRNGHTIRFRANGRSMHPTIRDGEELTVEPVAPRDVKKGDILLYQGAKGVIAHRVVGLIRTESRGLSNEQEKAKHPRDRSVVSDPQSSLLSTHYSDVSPQHSAHSAQVSVRDCRSAIRSRQFSIFNPRSSSFPAQSSSLGPRYSFILRGDAAITCDEPVVYGKILGRVVSVARNGRSVVLNCASAKLMRRIRLCALGIARRVSPALQRHIARFIA